MISRQIYAALEKGWGAYLSDRGPALFDDLFGKIWSLGPTEVAAISTYFRRLPPTLHHFYPRDDITNRPAIFIATSSESQPGFATGDYGGAGGAPVTPASVGFTPGSFLVPGSPVQSAANAGSNFVLSSLWTHQCQIMVLARGGPDPVVWAVEVCKSILLAAKTFFLSRAMQSVTLACSDVTFREDLAPSDLFARTITLQCGREFSQADTSQALQSAFKLPNIIGPEGSDTHPVGRPPAGINIIEP